MPRYLTFDEKTASTLRKSLPERQVFEHGATEAVEYALGTDKTLVTVIPTGQEQRTAIAVFRRPGQPANPRSPVEVRKPVASVAAPRENNVAVRAGGFLGLRDEVAFEEEPAVPKKQSWWRKFWPEDE